MLAAVLESTTERTPWLRLRAIRAAVKTLRNGGTLVDRMAERALPSFRNPPVTEVVAGVSFKPIEELSAPRIGQLWAEKLIQAFPRVEEQLPYEPPVERFDQRAPSISFGLEVGGFPRPRVWFVNQSGDEVVQIQHNYFACNWRKVRPDAEYGRWGSRRTAFATWFQVFRSFLAEQALGEVSPTQCEVTYVNHIEPADGWSEHGDAAAVFRSLAMPPFGTEGFGGRLEQVQMAEQFRLEREGEPFGRLHVVLQPAFRRVDNRPIYVLELTARGRPAGDSNDAVLAFLDEGREAIVRAFAALTTSTMHDVWQRHE